MGREGRREGAIETMRSRVVGISIWMEVGRPLPSRRNSTDTHPKIILKVSLLRRTPALLASAKPQKNET